MGALVTGRRRRRTLIFTVTVAHAKRLAEILNRWLPKSAESIDGSMSDDDRRDVLKRFSRGDTQFLCNCMIATEGFDEPRVELVVMARPTKSRALAVQMTGRGTRPAEDIAHVLGTLADAAARRAAIAASSKPSMTVLDFVGNTGRHKLVTVADVLGGVRYDEAVIERAKELMAEEGGEIDVEEALAEALEEAELEAAAARMDDITATKLLQEEMERQAIEAANRILLRATATYTVRDRDPFNTYDVAAVRDTGIKTGGASDAQVGLLMKLGVRRETAVGYSKRQASAVIEDLKSKRCTTKQAGALRRAGYSDAEIGGFNFARASEEINNLAANGWRREGAAA